MTLEELKATRPPTITVQQAAKIMGVTPRFIQAGLIQDRELARPQFPFGTAVHFTRWSYRIFTERFIAYMEGRDLREEVSLIGKIRDRGRGGGERGGGNPCRASGTQKKSGRA